MAHTQTLGQWGEEEAARYLEREGLRIRVRHFQTRWGEIDLIGRDRDTWVFVEVKTRARRYAPSAVDAITLEKQRKMALAALSYMKWKRLEECAMRFDVVLIESGRIEWLRDAFPAPEDYTF